MISICYTFYGQAANDCTQVHLNKEGYRKMAECIMKVLLTA